MSAGEDESGGVGKIIGLIALLFVGALVLVAFFMPVDTKNFFLNSNQKINDFFSSETFNMIRTFSGVLIVALTGFITWMFFRLLEMEKEHEEHVYHHASGHDDHAHTDEHKSSSKVADIFKDDSHLHEESSVEHSPRMKTAAPPVRLPGESGVRGVQTGEERPGHVQWQSVLRLATSNNPSDWKLAIIEADVILDMMTYMQGLPGNTLGERLNNTDPGGFKNLDYAKKAHYIRNRIAHDPNTDFSLREVQQAIRMYEEVFLEFKYI